MASSTSLLRIPTVTETDLKDFHSRHFPAAHLPSCFFLTPSASDSVDEDEDGLGWYLDGTKRTLTEDQLAMFRHSEIEGLLREIRHRKELEGSVSPEASPPPMAKIDTEHAIPSTDQTQSGPTKDAHPEEGLPQKTARKRTKSQKLKARADAARRAEADARLDKDDFIESGDERTFRRKARELDEQQEANVQLDY